MKKLLVALTGLVGIVTSSVSTIATVAPTKVENQMMSWRFPEQTYNQYVTDIHDLEFSIEINLSSIGIRGIDQLQSEYTQIHLNGLAITFLNADSPQINTDIWYTDRREMGDEDWTVFYDKVISSTQCLVKNSSSLWYSGSGDFMMRLRYKISCYEGANVSVQTGSTVDFWSY